MDLRTGERTPHKPEHFITKLVHFDYRPEKSTEIFFPFLKRIMGATETDESKLRAAQMIDFLQKAIGYSLTGVTSEKAVFILWGTGDNGKTTLLELFRFLLWIPVTSINALRNSVSSGNGTSPAVFGPASHCR